jgi:predicted dehydrogenase
MIKRILINGAGSAGARHFEIARSLFPNAQIAILTNRQMLDLNLGYKWHFTKVEEAINFQPNIAILAGAASSRIEIGLALANAGVHLLVEKPISVSTKSVENLIEICTEKNLTLAVGYNLRFHESLIYFRDQLSLGVISKPLLVKCEVGQFLPSWRESADYRHSVSAQRKLGGGVLFELSHEIDYLAWIFGKIDWVRATIMQQSSLEIDVEDSAFLTLGIENKVNPKLVASLSMDFIRHDIQRKCVVIGESGTLKWDGIKQQVSILKQGESSWINLLTTNHSSNDSYLAEWKDFIECLDTRQSPMATGRDGLKSLEVIEAALESAPTGKQIKIQRNSFKEDC